MDRHLSIAATVLLSLCSVYVFTHLSGDAQGVLLILAGTAALAIGLALIFRKASSRWGRGRVGGSVVALVCLISGLAYWKLQQTHDPWAGFKDVQSPAGHERWRNAPLVKAADGFNVVKDFSSTPNKIEVTGPDGRVIKLMTPEGATPEQIEAKIEEAKANWSSIIDGVPYEKWPNRSPVKAGGGAGAN